MKAMSWSRYHCLSWSFMRIRNGLRGGKSRRRHTVKTAAGERSRASEAALEGTGNDAPAADGEAARSERR
ncbi:hypothetical protein [Bradyrhizobium canariense]|uniref:Uncharacterized protein n=1 Tax=Bradyrhizobium canariense TaxID=255045 RepID=A0A1H2BQE1_9BRAD|nr:hypothetical protein [Bradyrhizobium canariense]SDT60471.1 hypothetical protein SAMN05444158_7433 [Bradyrhizobium canariense]